MGRLCILVIWVLGVISSPFSLANVPIQVRSQSPLQLFLLTPQAQASDFSSEQDSLSASIYGASVFAQADQYELDYYSVEYRLQLYYYPDPKWQLGLSWSEHHSQDARLDQISLSFHSMLGLDQNHRDEVPKHRSFIQVPQNDLFFADFSDQRLSRQWGLSLSHSFYQYKRHSLSTGVQLQYDDADSPLRQGARSDLAWQLDYRYQWRQHALYSMLAYSYHGAELVFGSPNRSSLWHINVGYQYRVGQRHQIQLGTMITQGALPGLGELGRPVFELASAYRYRREKLAFTLLILENIVHPDNSADFAIGGQIQYFY